MKMFWILLSVTIACGSDPSAQSNADAGQIGDANDSNCTEELCLEKPASGFQVVDTGTEIASGEDVEFCEIVKMPGNPGEKVYVNRLEAKMTKGSHHLIVAAIKPGSETEANAMVGDRQPCFGVIGLEGDPVIGSQSEYYDEPYPENVGRVYEGGQLLVFNYHYYNTTDKPLTARAVVNFHTVPKEQVKYVAQIFGFYNLGINVPPMGSQELTTTCTIKQDINVFKLTRHTHRWGQNVPVDWFTGEGTQLVYESPNYETPDFLPESPLQIKKGQGFSFTCNYQNDENRTLQFGENATDEMCILFGHFYTDANVAQGSLDCFRDGNSG